MLCRAVGFDLAVFFFFLGASFVSGDVSAWGDGPATASAAASATILVLLEISKPVSHITALPEHSLIRNSFTSSGTKGCSLVAFLQRTGIRP